jgi:serine protease
MKGNKNMKKKGAVEKRLGYLCANRMNLLWSRLHTRRIVAGTAVLSLAVALSACGGSVGSSDDASSAASVADNQMLAAAKGAAGSGTISLPIATKMNATSLTTDATTDRFIVRYKSGTVERGSMPAVQSRLDRLTGAFPSRARHSRRMGLGSDVVTTERKLNAKEAMEFMRAMASDPDVEYVEPDAPMSGSSVPNDPYYKSQWALKSNFDVGQPYAGIRAEGAWTMASGAGTVIAVVDSGVANHSDLNANILPGYDFSYEGRGGNGSDTGVPPGYTCSVTWHGTHVAGIAAALANNGVGIAGVAPSAKMVSSRALNGCGNGFTSNISDAIIWAAGGTVPGTPVNTHPATVINLSLGGKGQCSATYQDAIDYAASRGAIVVVAAMNAGTSASDYQPANCRNVIAVGNSQPSGSRNPSSNHGPIVDIAAPGTNIWSTYNTGTSLPGAESYAYMDGTSMSAPMVSGVVALAQSVAPRPLTGPEMRVLLQQHAQPFPVTPDQPIGAGILDATATVAAAKAGEIPTVTDFKCTQNTEAMQLVCQDLSTARGAGAVRSWDWDDGTGKPHTVVTQSTGPVFSYEVPGTYQITLKVTDAKGAVRTSTQPYQVGPLSVTDLTYSTAPVVFSLAPGEERYFSYFVPSSGVRTKWWAAPYPTVDFKLTPAFSNNKATMDLVSDSLVMSAPGCTATMQGGIPATCQGRSSRQITYYVRVRPAPKTSLNSVSISSNFWVFHYDLCDFPELFAEPDSVCGNRPSIEPNVAG